MLSTITRFALLILLVAVAPSASRFAALQADQSLFSQIGFDYIIVGGGTAGLALATRLTEVSSLTVGVIEAGLFHPQESMIDTPERFGQNIGSDLDWGYVTVPQPALNGGVVAMSSGKMMGGSSGLNFEAFTRASKPEYDAWETLGNGPTWNFNSLLPFFKKSETFHLSPPQGIFPNATALTKDQLAPFHGFTGPIQSAFNVIYGTIVMPAAKAMNALGIKTNSDPGNGDATGVFNLPSTVDRTQGVRSYSASAYFPLAGNRPNLHVLTGVHANKIVFSPSTNNGKLVATGVQYTFNGFPFTVNATKEVILCAGAVQTPKILELSGIGDKTLLSSLGIPTLLDLPQVGENLQDQPIINSDWLLHPDVIGGDLLRNNVSFALQQLNQYETSNTGAYATTVPEVAFLSLLDIIPGDANATIDALNKTLTAELANTKITPLYAAQLAIQLDWLRRRDIAHTEFIVLPAGGLTPTPPAPGASYMTFTSGLMHPFGRGSIHINSTNHLESPVISPHFLELTIDAQVFAIAGNFTSTLANTQPLAASVIGPSTPPASEDFLTYTRKFLGTIHHYIGTAALAPRDHGGVVDPNLIVYGTSNVRVVDASVIPLQIATHPQSTVYAIAEKAADMIKAKHE